MTDFAGLLRGCREDGGHKSAREFFKGCGGRPAVGCTYQQYLNIEAGRSAPKLKIFHRLMVLLSVWKDPEKARELAKAYLAAQLGSGEPLDFILRSLGPPPPTPGSPHSPLRKAFQRDAAARVKPLSVEQSRLIRSSPAHYWSFRVLAGDRGSWSPEDLSLTLGLPAGAVRRAVQDLAGAELAASDKDGRFRSPYRDSYAVHQRQPERPNYEEASFLPELRPLWERMEKRHGKTLFHHYIVLRGSESEARQYYPYLAQAVYGLGLYDTIDKGPDTSFLVAEASVRRLRPF